MVKQFLGFRATKSAIQEVVSKLRILRFISPLAISVFFVSLLICTAGNIPAVKAVENDTFPSEATNQESSRVRRTTIKDEGINPPPFDEMHIESGGSIRYLSITESLLSILVLVFGVVTIVIESLLIRNKRFEVQEMLKVLGVTLIVVGTLFIITAGFDSDQIAPAMGLFGTIAGYLLGHRAGNRVNNASGEND